MQQLRSKAQELADYIRVQISLHNPRDWTQTLPPIEGYVFQDSDVKALERLDRAIAADDDTLSEYLRSNSLWGGAGSIADQALMGRPQECRHGFYKLMVELGSLQVEQEIVNPRTEWVVQVLRTWIAKGIV